MSVSFFLSSVGIIFAAIFQGVGNGNYSMYLAFMRQVTLLILILLMGAFMGNLAVIWSGFAIAELLASSLFTYLSKIGCKPTVCTAI